MFDEQDVKCSWRDSFRHVAAKIAPPYSTDGISRETKLTQEDLCIRKVKLRIISSLFDGLRLGFCSLCRSPKHEAVLYHGVIMIESCHEESECFIDNYTNLIPVQVLR